MISRFQGHIISLYIYIYYIYIYYNVIGSVFHYNGEYKDSISVEPWRDEIRPCISHYNEKLTQ
jgi:hypothetical protein